MKSKEKKTNSPFREHRMHSKPPEAPAYGWHPHHMLLLFCCHQGFKICTSIKLGYRTLLEYLWSLPDAIKLLMLPSGERYHARALA
jgi:hypothetical protein